MDSPNGLTISIAIPTYGREKVLTDTIQAILNLNEGQTEFLIVDQTDGHSGAVGQRLSAWYGSGDIEWMKRKTPSITKSMNAALRRATSDLVLFLDDDITPQSGLISEHLRCHRENPEIWASVGQVVQPWQQPGRLPAPRLLTGLRQDFDFPFHSTIADSVSNVMAGNLCVRRERALSVGGFDENFLGAAYRFETDFARRIITAGGEIRFCPSASIDHLRVERGGTRQQGSHLTSADPRHGIGDHYYAFLHGKPLESWQYCMSRVVREVCSRFHLTHPWWIPVKLVGELRALLGGWKLAKKKLREARSDAQEREQEERNADTDGELDVGSSL